MFLSSKTKQKQTDDQKVLMARSTGIAPSRLGKRRVLAKSGALSQDGNKRKHLLFKQFLNNQPLQLTFKNGQTACAIQVDHSVDLSAALNQIGLHGSRPVLVVVGGASKMSDQSMARLRLLFVNVLAPIAETLGACVVDGGTDTGVMQMMGQARAEIAGTFPLVGIAPVGKIALPDAPPSSSGQTSLEPNHTHFVLIPGSTWGDESPWLARIATTLADEKPSVTVMANGGAITLLDLFENKKAGRPLVVLGGSGRLADEITMAVRYPEQEARESVTELLQPNHLQQNNLTCYDLSQPFSDLTKIIMEGLTRQSMYTVKST